MIGMADCREPAMTFSTMTCQKCRLLRSQKYYGAPISWSKSRSARDIIDDRPMVQCPTSTNVPVLSFLLLAYRPFVLRSKLTTNLSRYPRPHSAVAYVLKYSCLCLWPHECPQSVAGDDSPTWHHQQSIAACKGRREEIAIWDNT